MVKKKAKARPKTSAKVSPRLATPAEKKATVLVLRTCKSNLTSYGGFQWPASGPVSAPDWKPKAECGHGLHGLIWGEGNGELVSWGPEAKWLVVEVEADLIVDLTDKVKFPRGTVVHCGDRKSATDYLAAHGALGRSVVGGTSTSGYGGTSTSGYRGTSTSGVGGTSTSGVGGTSTSGVGGTSTSGVGGTSTSGVGGTSTSGYGGTSTSGYGGTSTSGYRGTSTSGVGGTSTSGYGGTSTSGVGGTSTSGYGGTSTSGVGGAIMIKWWDESTGRYRVALGYPGEDGIKPNAKYRVNGLGKLEEVPEPAQVPADPVKPT